MYRVIPSGRKNMIMKKCGKGASARGESEGSLLLFPIAQSGECEDQVISKKEKENRLRLKKIYTCTHTYTHRFIHRHKRTHKYIYMEVRVRQPGVQKL